MHFDHIFTNPDIKIYNQIKWKKIDTEIKDGKTGKIIFEQKNVEVPESWSQNASNILASRYFHKTLVPHLTKQIPEGNLPRWLLRSIPIEPVDWEEPKFSGETSAHQVFHRMVGCWTYWGWKEGILKDEPSAKAFYYDLYWILAKQMGAPNSPQWFNTGLYWAYGIEGSSTGQWAIDHSTGEPYLTSDAYSRPQAHACFLQPVEDDLINPNGIMDLFRKEVLLFKGGSGSGTNWDKVRGKGEPLSGGGVSSGVMSFLPIGDTSAGSIASGGVTRRAAKLVTISADHPEIIEFINWKTREELKAGAMELGSMKIAEMLSGDDPDIDKALAYGIRPAIVDRIVNGKIKPEIFDCNWEGEAIKSIQGQNANNSVRLKNIFFDKLTSSSMWDLTWRTNGQVCASFPTEHLWNEICKCAWASGDPGLLFHDTINKYNTCKNDGEINTTNPCAEFHHLDNTACNLASLNLCAFNNEKTFNPFDTDWFKHACRLLTIVLEISVYMASYPSRDIAIASENYRTLGLGYANLGNYLMTHGMGYDSDSGRDWAASITALMHFVSALTSREMAEELGPFPRYEANKISALEVMELHKKDLVKIDIITPIWNAVNDTCFKLSTGTNGVLLKDSPGLRNAQLTLIAPTGTISFVMDCKTTGIEPNGGLITYKSLAGGGNFKMVNEDVEKALRFLNYEQDQIEAICKYIVDNDTIDGAPYISEEDLEIFDCAFPSGESSRCLAPMAHVKMMEVVQPFLSGAISKTVNLPNSATIEDVKYIYMESYKRGLKAVALYRDGCKLNQPLMTKKAEVKSEVNLEPKPELKSTTSSQFSRGERELLSMRRQGNIQKYRIGSDESGTSFHLTTGNYTSGRLAEIFINLGREGSTIRSMSECFAKSISLGLQFGVPLDAYVKAFIFTHFEPAGYVDGGPESRIKFCTSLVDLIFRSLAVEYLNRDDLADKPKEILEPQITSRPDLDLLIKQSIEKYNSLTPDQKKEVDEEQRQSWVKAEMELSRMESETTTLIQPKPFNNLEVCPKCHNATMVRNGTCSACTICSYNSGCGG